MKAHEWDLREECFGPIGCEDVWYCKGCDAHGGMSTYNRDTDKPSAPKHHYMRLPEDCEISLAMIAAYELGKEYGKECERRDIHYKNVTRPWKDRLKYLFTKTLL